MKERAWIIRHWKLLLNLLTFLALVILVYPSRRALVSTLHQLGHVKIWILLLIVPVEALNYHAQAKLYQRLFAIVGNSLSYGYLFKASVELNFVNHVFP